MTITLSNEERKLLRLLLSRDIRMNEKKRAKLRPDGDFEKIFQTKTAKIQFAAKLHERLGTDA